jgi:toxin ParE1/3/4
VVERYEVYFSARAIEDLDRLFSYIAARTSFETADGYLDRIERLCLSLQTLPNRGTAVRGPVSGLRTMGFERRATILFRVGEKRVNILRILYGGRDLESQFERAGE